MQSEKRKKLFLIEKGYYDLIDKYFKDVYNKALKEDFAGYYYKIKSTMKTPV